jgi:L-cysteine desulfidase
MYKNCYAVGIPHTRHRTGIAWAVALGSHLSENALGLEIFRTVDEKTLADAGSLIDGGRIRIDVDKSKTRLWIDCAVEKTGGRGRAVISGEHTHVARLEKNGAAILVEEREAVSPRASMREQIAAMPLPQMLEMARQIGPEDRKLLRQGVEMNKKIAQHGIRLFPSRFISLTSHDELAGISRLVCAGVYARMWGEEFTVMSLAGSGNKGIVASIPIYMHAERLALSEAQADEALALACLITSATTCRLGTLSAVCGCSNAAGIGLAAGLVLLEGGGDKEISLAMNNMVGNLSGMICDGAKIGCALKTMTSVDAARPVRHRHPAFGRHRGGVGDAVPAEPRQARVGWHGFHGHRDPRDHAGEARRPPLLFFGKTDGPGGRTVAWPRSYGQSSQWPSRAWSPRR